MYSSPLTGLTVQYDRRTCEDDYNWVSTMDNSLRCSSLSPTDERCHQYDVNGNSGYDSCPKSCGNCFEDTPSASEDTDDAMESQPMGLYSGESGETNEFDPLGSSSRGRGDLEDLVYKFTYEINDKINDLSEKIDGVKDDTESQIKDNEENNRGICYKQVCEKKTATPVGNTTCSGDDDMCDKQLYSNCLINPCCQLIVAPDGSPAIPDYVMAGENECDDAPGENYFHLPFSKDIADDDIEYFQRSLTGEPATSPSGTNNGQGPAPQSDFNITITNSGQQIHPGSNPVEHVNITHISLADPTDPSSSSDPSSADPSSADPSASDPSSAAPSAPSDNNITKKISGFSIGKDTKSLDFFYNKHLYWAAFKSITSNSIITNNEQWNTYSFDNTDRETPLGEDYDYLVIKITSHEINNKKICGDDDEKNSTESCNIFKEKNAKYYVYSFAGGYSQTSDFPTKDMEFYGKFYYAVKNPNNTLQFSKLTMIPKVPTSDGTDSYPMVTGDPFESNIVGIYFEYNIENLFRVKSNTTLSISGKSLDYKIEYPLENDDSDMKVEPTDNSDILSLNNNLESPIPFLYKIHGFDSDHNFNLAKIRIKIEGENILGKDVYNECDSTTVEVVWWVSQILIALVILSLYTFYFTFGNELKPRDKTNILFFSFVIAGLVLFIPFFGKELRAIFKICLYILVYLFSYSYGKEITGTVEGTAAGKYARQITKAHGMMLLSIIYLMNTNILSDYINKFTKPDEEGCGTNAAKPICYGLLMSLFYLAVYLRWFPTKYAYYGRKVLLMFLVVMWPFFSQIFIKDNDGENPNYIIDRVYNWFGYSYGESGNYAYLTFAKLLRDIFILM
jgi:hypothetical protein